MEYVAPVHQWKVKEGGRASGPPYQYHPSDLWPLIAALVSNCSARFRTTGPSYRMILMFFYWDSECGEGTDWDIVGRLNLEWPSNCR